MSRPSSQDSNALSPKPADSDRRAFLKATSAAAFAAPLSTTTILRATDKSGRKSPIVGRGEFTFECQHGWGELPGHVVWGETHGVAVDRAGSIYIKHRSSAAEPMDAIVVFDPDGKFVRSFGKEYHGGGHGIDIRQEGNEEFLYLSDVKRRQFAKTTLQGEQLWVKGAPQEAGVYNDQTPFNPTNIGFAPDGGFYVADGYGSSYIHQFDKNAQHVRFWGGLGDAPGKMKTPHGLWLDDRPGREPSLVVADRANARLQYFTLAGEHIGFVNDMSFPADVDLQGEILLVPDLHARVTLLDKDNQVIDHLGYDAEWTRQVTAAGFPVRKDPSLWRPGKFVHPHDACFDAAGNIFVTEWVPTGRVTKLLKVS